MCEVGRTRHGCGAGPQLPSNIKKTRNHASHKTDPQPCVSRDGPTTTRLTRRTHNHASHKTDPEAQQDLQKWLDAQNEEGQARLRAGNMRDWARTAKLTSSKTHKGRRPTRYARPSRSADDRRQPGTRSFYRPL
eukprot:366111-Chlamydomonas_euryale.AAC.18